MNREPRRVVVVINNTVCMAVTRTVGGGNDWIMIYGYMRLSQGAVTPPQHTMYYKVRNSKQKGIIRFIYSTHVCASGGSW